MNTGQNKGWRISIAGLYPVFVCRTMLIHARFIYFKPGAYGAGIKPECDRLATSGFLHGFALGALGICLAGWHDRYEIHLCT